MPTLTADSMVARAILAANRPVKSAGAPAHPERMARHDALEIWYDPQHAFLVMVGCVAIRAVTDQGRFCWLVRQNGAADALSYVKSPYDVVPARNDDDGLGVPHPAVTELAASLRRGEIRIPLAPTDFRGTGRALEFLASHGMPGWLAAWLMPVVPAIGRAIWAGHRRTLEIRRLRQAEAAGVTATPATWFLTV
jgi:hypothetical protein